MKQLDRILRSPVRDAFISALLTSFGFFLQPIIERIVPPVFSPQNLPGITFTIIAFSMIVSISLWRASQRSTQEIAERLDYLTKEIEQDANLVPYDVAYRQLASWVDEAVKDVRILTFYPKLPNSSNVYDFGSQRMRSPERALWFEAANRAIERTKKSQLEFIRIVQISTGKLETEPTSEEVHIFMNTVMQDTLNQTQFALLFKMEATERASLKASRVYMTNSFVLIDGKHLFMDIDIWHPNDLEFRTPFVMLASDLTGKRFEDLWRMHKRIEGQTPVYTPADHHLDKETCSTA